MSWSHQISSGHTWSPLPYRVLLDYLTVNGGEDDQAAMNARHFYICQWYRSAGDLGKMPKRKKRTPQKQQQGRYSALS